MRSRSACTAALFVALAACAKATDGGSTPDAGAPAEADAGRSPSPDAGAEPRDAGSDRDADSGPDRDLDSGSDRDPERCFSPTQNPELAGEPRAHGCACDLPETGICIGSVALICERNARGLVWVARQDGPCLARDPDCSDFGQRRPDAQSCIADFATCYELEDGEFCGLGCTAELDCDVQSCPDAESEPDCTFALSVREGVCGDVRWRVDGRGFTASVYYWDAGSGELLAMTESSDTPQYCDGASFSITYGDEQVVRRCEILHDDSTLVCGR